MDDYEEAYFKDILPEIGGSVFGNEKETVNVEEIAEGLARYSPEEVEEVLNYVHEQDEIYHLGKEENGAWSLKAFEAETWEEVDEELEESEEQPEVPDVRDRVKNLSAQEYGKLRNNLEEVYEGLKEVKDERTSYFSTSDLKKRVSNVRPAEIGVVLSGLAAAGLVKKYRDRNDYEPESIDEERIKAFKEAVDAAESFEDFKEMVTEERK